MHAVSRAILPQDNATGIDTSNGKLKLNWSCRLPKAADPGRDCSGCVMKLQHCRNFIVVNDSCFSECADWTTLGVKRENYGNGVGELRIDRSPSFASEEKAIRRWH